jgi:hypothetical protein
VNVLFGSSGGLSTSGSQQFDQETAGVFGSAEDVDNMGYALAAGDMNGDGYDDLVVGAPGEDVGPGIDAGGVTVLYGSSSGLSSNGSQWFDQRTPGITGLAESEDLWGQALAAGDLNGDGYADLAVGAPGEEIEGATRTGGVNVLYGSADGLTTSGSRWFHQNLAGVFGSAEVDDSFGQALAIGDLNGDGYGDLVVGVPGEKVGPAVQAGGVNVLYGSPGGLSTIGSQWFDQRSPGITGSAETGDRFGLSLAIGYLDGDGNADLAVGVPAEDIDSAWDAGGVNVLYGSSAGLSTAGSQWFHQNLSGVIGSAELHDGFGSALTIWSTPQRATYLPLLLRWRRG